PFLSLLKILPHSPGRSFTHLLFSAALSFPLPRLSSCHHAHSLSDASHVCPSSLPSLSLHTLSPFFRPIVRSPPIQCCIHPSSPPPPKLPSCRFYPTWLMSLPSPLVDTSRYVDFRATVCQVCGYPPPLPLLSSSSPPPLPLLSPSSPPPLPLLSPSSPPPPNPPSCQSSPTWLTSLPSSLAVISSQLHSPVPPLLSTYVTSLPTPPFFPRMQPLPVALPTPTPPFFRVCHIPPLPDPPLPSPPLPSFPSPPLPSPPLSLPSPPLPPSSSQETLARLYPSLPTPASLPPTRQAERCRVSVGPVELMAAEGVGADAADDTQ
ncbi:unnamed protein product, partial [Closterium sp. NIES-54]